MKHDGTHRILRMGKGCPLVTTQRRGYSMNARHAVGLLMAVVRRLMIGRVALAAPSGVAILRAFATMYSTHVM